MGPYAFSQAFLCGFFAFASLSSIVLWWGARQERTLLTLSIVCAIGVLQTHAALLVASATTVPEAQLAIQLRTMSGALVDQNPFFASAISTFHRTVPSFASSAIRWASGVVR